MTATAPLPVESLDRSRPHGQVYGETSHNIAFTQRALGLQGWPYDAHGKLIEGALNPEQKKKLKEKRDAAAAQAKADAKKPAAKASAAELPQDELEDHGERPAAPAAVVQEENLHDEVNLVMWLKGEVRYKPFEIQNALKARYKVNKPQLQAAALYLVEEQKVLPRSQVHPSILPPLPKSDD